MNIITYLCISGGLVTFVLNVLRQDFSLLATDRLAISKEPATLKIGQMTIKVNGETRMNGFMKVLLNSDRDLAVGFAGTVGPEDYRVEVAKANGAQNALRVLHCRTSDLPGGKREDIERGTFATNEWIATYFDPPEKVFFTVLGTQSGMINYRQKFMQSGSLALLLTAGSGGSVFQSCVGNSEIEDFASWVRLPDGSENCLRWLADAFDKISKADSGCGSDFDAFLATRETPNFQRVIHPVTRSTASYPQ